MSGNRARGSVVIESCSAMSQVCDVVDRAVDTMNHVVSRRLHNSEKCNTELFVYMTIANLSTKLYLMHYK